MSDDNVAYYKDPPQQILALMKDTFGSRFGAYFLGSPTYDYPDAAFPACVVQSVQSRNTVTNAPTGTDEVSELVHLHFFEQSKDQANASDDVQTAIRVLYEKIQGRDPATGFYLPGTAMYALRTNITLKSGSTGFQTTLDHDIQIDYDIIPRANRPTILEALITIVTRERITVNNRV